MYPKSDRETEAAELQWIAKDNFQLPVNGSGCVAFFPYQRVSFNSNHKRQP